MGSDVLSKHNVGIILFVAVWAVLAAMFGYADLTISRAVADPEAGWARVFTAFGEHPAMLLAWAAASLAVRLLRSPGLAWRLLQAACAAVAAAIGAAAVLIAAGRWFGIAPSPALIAVSLALSAAVSWIAQMLLRRLPDEQLEPYRAAVWATLAVIAGELLLVHLLKLAWGRVRFRDLLPDASNFAKWYAPQRVSGHRSFPSAHAANAWTLLCLLMYVPERRKSWSLAALVLAAGWGLATAYSRIVSGAHYASDVLFGSCLTISLFYAAWRFGGWTSRPLRFGPKRSRLLKTR